MPSSIARLLAVGIAALLLLACASPATAHPRGLAARRRLAGLTSDPGVAVFDADGDGMSDTVSVKDAGGSTYSYFPVRSGGVSAVGEAAAAPPGEALLGRRVGGVPLPTPRPGEAGEAVR